MTYRKPAIFDLELRPSRPLQPQHLRLLLALVLGAFLFMALPLAAMGAWPILPFMALAMGITLWALRESIRSGRQSEHLRLDADGLELIRIAAHGRVRRLHLPADWARIELETLGPRENRLWLLSAGQRVPVGYFLSPAERVEIAAIIEDGLQRFQAGMA